VTTDATHPAAATTWRREVAIAAAALGFGLLVLPFAIYVVGQQLIGEYVDDGAGPMDLAEAIWSDLLALQLPAWVLVLSPYLVVQLVRSIRRVWRRKSL
jgi:hypothetical protein